MAVDRRVQSENAVDTRSASPSELSRSANTDRQRAVVEQSSGQLRLGRPHQRAVNCFHC